MSNLQVVPTVLSLIRKRPRADLFFWLLTQTCSSNTGNACVKQAQCASSPLGPESLPDARPCLNFKLTYRMRISCNTREEAGSVTSECPARRHRHSGHGDLEFRAATHSHFWSGHWLQGWTSNKVSEILKAHWRQGRSRPIFPHRPLGN